MKVRCKREYTIDLQGQDADVLMKLLQSAIYHKEDLIKDLTGKATPVNQTMLAIVDCHNADIDKAREFQKLISEAR